jgi:hypothetical protein
MIKSIKREHTARSVIFISVSLLSSRIRRLFVFCHVNTQFIHLDLFEVKNFMARAASALSDQVKALETRINVLLL